MGRADLARLAGVGERALRYWIDGRATPRADLAGKLHRATGGAVPADQW